MAIKLPDFSFEQSCWNEGYSIVIGVDEVGRGALAGSVVAGAATLKRIMNHESRIKEIQAMGIDDSKQLKPMQREKLASLITKYFHFAIGEATVSEINRLGIVKATHRAMRRAIVSLWSLVARRSLSNKKNISRIASDQRLIANDRSRFLLVDGYPVKYMQGFRTCHQQAIIKGDQKSISIAAASIVAKVHRDNLMRNLAHQFPGYGWETNVGYGTRSHLAAIRSCGLSIFHRQLFVDHI